MSACFTNINAVFLISREQLALSQASLRTAALQFCSAGAVELLTGLFEEIMTVHVWS